MTDLAQAAGEKTLSVSAIVCCYTDRRWQEIQDAVDSLKAQSLRPNEILIVVDHNPDLFERLRSELVGVTIISNAYARGLTGARNTGVEASDADIVAFLDDDANRRAALVEESGGRVRRAGRGGRRRPDRPCLGGLAAGLVSTRVRLGRGL